MRREAISALRSLIKGAERFDLIMIDPPYGSPLAVDLLAGSGDLLNPGGMLVLEVSKRTSVEGAVEGLELLTEKCYGDTLIYLFERA